MGILKSLKNHMVVQNVTKSRHSLPGMCMTHIRGLFDAVKCIGLMQAAGAWFIGCKEILWSTMSTSVYIVVRSTEFDIEKRVSITVFDARLVHFMSGAFDGQNEGDLSTDHRTLSA